MSHLSMVKSDEHARALIERDLFLTEHPELRELQQKIDDRLRKAMSMENRLVVIHDLMMESFMRLDRKLKNLLESLRDFQVQ
ncbi:MAG: hypothetical protein HY912_12935 [Desulfomonile tiedjei]|uniref:Uncharacterized protein n=1 Tax=Desulfomonile tiedjei TaxID=2358 RepID=A0A9D6Z0W9_9BACT|nr:hypothetical protein [Desulfomonile tiedjei]